MNQQAFQREGMLIEQLQNEGKAAMMQAGGSRTKLFNLLLQRLDVTQLSLGLA